MLEILAILAVLLAAHKGKPRRMGRYIRGTIDISFDLGTLAGNTLISATIGGTVTERTLVTSIVTTWGVDAWTPSTNVGPLLVGVAHSDYTDTEIEQYIELATSWSEADKIGQEVGRRKVRRIGLILTPGSAVLNAILNEGRPVKTKLNWILTQGQTLKVWAYNTGTGNFATTDPDVTVSGHANLFPK